MRYPFTASEESISVFFAGSMRSIPSTDPGFAELSAHLKGDEHDYATIEGLIDKPKMISRLTEGQVTVVGNTVYHKGNPVHTTLAEKLVYLLGDGYDAKPWARFMDRVMDNPSERSRDCLFDFLSVWDAPIDADGCFIAFKRVTEDYKDFYTRSFDNSPGARVEIPRDKVNPDPDVKCSYGLHVAASSYLGHYHSRSGRVIACKVAPEDVVAVPGDYGFAKMRVCAYTVLGDAMESFVNNAHTQRVYAPDPEKVANAPDDGKEDDYTDSYGKGHNVERFTDDTDGTDSDPHLYPVDIASDTTEMSFTRGGVTYWATQIAAGVKKHGQRGFQRMTGVPRSTIQEWLKKIGNEASKKLDAELKKEGFTF